MSETTDPAPARSSVDDRAAAILEEQSEAGHRTVDLMFSVLLIVEWLASIGVALVVSPTAWAGELHGVHPHVWAAILLGGLSASVPVALAWFRPGRPSTRRCVAIGQMLLVALLIHLSGGRLETHFHVFGSLAFLALYRDWRVMVTASLVVALDHFFRGIYWPRSVFGLEQADPWRWAEHSLWVAFEDVVLIFGMARSCELMRGYSRRSAELEATRDREIEDQKRSADVLRRSHEGLESRVRERTAALERANADLLVEVAERRKAEIEALRSRETAELATRAKSQFLANMSHEIRTPMNAIIGMTELTLDMELGAEQRDNLDLVRVAADSLLALIDDILDFSKIEAGRLDLEPIPFRPRETVDAASKTLSLRAREKGLALSVEVDPGVPEALVGDPHRLRQILLNLIGNAIKFTAKGRVEVRVGAEEEVAGGFVLRFSVLDEGIGIPSSRLGMIFDPFTQADESTTRRFGGTGLGLSISTRLVELMGGKIWVDSEVGRGSKFHFTARFGKPAQAEAAPAKERPAPDRIPGSADSDRLQVLLVDDNELNRRVGSRLIERMGHEVRLAADGFEAVARYEDEGPFDLVLMDVQMPGMDGIEATALIRAIQARQTRACPIVALTAFAMKADRDRCLAAGMDDHLAKPIRAEELERLVRSCVPVDRGDDLPEPRWARDLDEVRSLMPFEGEEMAEVVGLFRESCREHLNGMARAIIDDEPDELARAAHSLMGCLGMFAGRPTIALAAKLEEAGRSGDLESALATLSRLEEAIAWIQPSLERLILADRVSILSA